MGTSMGTTALHPTTGPSPRTGQAAYLLRSPVFNSSLGLTGYEVLLKGPSVGEAERTTAVLETFAEVSAHVLAGGQNAFLRLPRAFLTGELPSPVQAGSVIFEVLEDDLTDPAVAAGVISLATAGHRLSLVGTGLHPDLRPLLACFDLFRVHVARFGADALAALKRRGALFVDGVETLAQVDACRRVEADFLSGGLVGRSSVLADSGLAPTQLSCLRLATALVRLEPDLDAVELAVRSDPALTVRVLKTVNSAAGGLRQRVSSIRQAVVLLGPRALLGCVLSAGLAQGGATTPPEAVSAVLVRARMCELLAAAALNGPVDGSSAFTVGLLAGLDTLLGTDLADIVAELAVDDGVEGAVLNRSGPLGTVLDDVFAYEELLPARLLDTPAMRLLYLDSLTWASHVILGSPA
jgi:c-di-GMP-related signal transduction protein